VATLDRRVTGLYFILGPLNNQGQSELGAYEEKTKPADARRLNQVDLDQEHLELYCIRPDYGVMSNPRKDL